MEFEVMSAVCGQLYMIDKDLRSVLVNYASKNYAFGHSVNNCKIRK